MMRGNRGQTAAEPTGQPGTIQGRVHSLAGVPLKRATVQLRVDGGRGGQPLTTATDAAGVFTFPSVDPGQYRLSAERTGFVRQEYGQKKPNRPGLPISVGPAQEIRDLAFQLIPGAVVTGRTLDEDGERMANSRISVLRIAYQNGRRRLIPMNTTVTNDLGEYRIHGVAPGRYYIAAAPSVGGIGNVVALSTANKEAVEVTYASVYYPNSNDSARAVPVEIAAGAELRGIDFNFQPVRTFRMKGRIVGLEPAARGGNRPVVMLSPRDGSEMASRHHSEVDPATGAFEIRGVIPGSYMLTAMMRRENRQQTARMPIEVAAANIEGINLAVPPEMPLIGKVQIEGAPANIDTGRVRVLLEAREGAPMGAGVAQVQADGRFTIANLGPDQYTVEVLGLTEDLYLKSARAASVDVTEAPLDLRSGAAPESLDIVVGANGGRVEGVLLNDKQEPAVRAMAVLVPETSRRTLRRFYKIAVSGEDGRFQMRGIPPGEYKVFGWDDIETGAHMDPTFLEKYESRGVTVRVREGTAEVVSLKLITVE